MPFTDEELSLLDAIHADPMSDAPRIAYAFWLQTHGQMDYADFIRLDLRFANEVCNPKLSDEEQYRNWRGHVEGVRHQHLESICGPWAEPLPTFAKNTTFDRGIFLVEIPQEIDPAVFVAELEVASPRIRYTLELMETSPPKLLEVIGTGRVGSVWLRPVFAGRQGSTRERHSASLIEAMRVLFACPHIHLLQAVSISMAKILTEEAKAVWRELAPPFLPEPWPQ